MRVVTTGVDGSVRRTRTFDPPIPANELQPRVADVESTDDEYVPFGSLYSFGDADTSRAFVVNVVDDS